MTLTNDNIIGRSRTVDYVNQIGPHPSQQTPTTVQIGDYSYVINGSQDNATSDGDNYGDEPEYIEMQDLDVEQGTSGNSIMSRNSEYLAPVNNDPEDDVSDECNDVMLPGQHPQPSNYDELGFRPPARPNVYDKLKNTKKTCILEQQSFR